MKPPSDDYTAYLPTIRGRFADSGVRLVASYVSGAFFLLITPSIFVYALFERGVPSWPLSSDEWACAILILASISVGVFLWLSADVEYEFTGSEIVHRVRGIERRRISLASISHAKIKTLPHRTKVLRLQVAGRSYDILLVPSLAKYFAPSQKT